MIIIPQTILCPSHLVMAASVVSSIRASSLFTSTVLTWLVMQYFLCLPFFVETFRCSINILLSCNISTRNTIILLLCFLANVCKVFQLAEGSTCVQSNQSTDLVCAVLQDCHYLRTCTQCRYNIKEKKTLFFLTSCTNAAVNTITSCCCGVKTDFSVLPGHSFLHMVASKRMLTV